MKDTHFPKQLVYWVILWKHLDISRAELFAQGFSIQKHHHQQVAILNISDHQQDIEKTLTSLGWIVKRGVIIPTDEIEETDLLGVYHRELGWYLKKIGKTKRYKEIDLLHTDQEVAGLWREYVQLDSNFDTVLHITNYQNIDRFSTIDYDKPVNSMQIGMMPAKLTQIMVNIGIWKSWRGVENSWEAVETPWKRIDRSWEHITQKTVYDPFMWLGTTYMIANSMGYNVIWSDINITPAKQNLPWRKEQEIAHDLPITLFAHDATQALHKPFLKYVSCVVTEGRLGHIVTAKTRPTEIQQYSLEIQKLYIAWINNMYPIWEHMTIVCAIPHHTGGDNKHIDAILQHCEKKWISIETIPQVYTRSGQKVGRKIVILSW